MTLPVTLRIELPRERGPERELHLGQRLTLGRPMPGQGGPDRLVVPGRWLGVRQEGMVSAELLRIVYQDVDEGRAVLGWRTRAQHHPTAIRFGIEPIDGAPPGIEPDLAAEGRIVVGPGEVCRLVVSRLSAEQRRFVTRFAVQFAAAGPAPRRSMPQPPWIPITRIESGHWLPLVENWWTSKRPEAGLTWQRCLSVTSRLVADDGALPGELASAVAQALHPRGFPDADPAAVRKAWTRAMTRLVEVLTDPDLDPAFDAGRAPECRPDDEPRPGLAWMVPALAVPGLAKYLAAREAGEREAGGVRPRLPAGEEQIRSLVVALRATGRAEWQ
jgi:hypothetical protein